MMSQDMQLRKLDGTAFEAEFGRASRSCFPHGIIGQVAWRGAARVRRGVARRGVAWRGVVRCGVVWCVVWCGVV